MLRFNFSVIVMVLCYTSIFSQRSYGKNQNAWLVYSGDHKFMTHWGVHLEYQERRSEILNYNQQRLFRVALNYHPVSQAFVSFGYALAITYPYGVFPVLKVFPENRIYQQLQFSTQLAKVETQTRFRFEQRWLKLPIRIDSVSNSLENNKYFGRFRLAQRFSFPFKGNRIMDKSFYATISEELFVNYGKNV